VVVVLLLVEVPHTHLQQQHAGEIVAVHKPSCLLAGS
jgi:hypothetical protein